MLPITAGIFVCYFYSGYFCGRRLVRKQFEWNKFAKRSRPYQKGPFGKDSNNAPSLNEPVLTLIGGSYLQIFASPRKKKFELQLNRKKPVHFTVCWLQNNVLKLGDIMKSKVFLDLSHFLIWGERMTPIRPLFKKFVRKKI